MDEQGRVARQKQHKNYYNAEGQPLKRFHEARRINILSSENPTCEADTRKTYPLLVV